MYWLTVDPGETTGWTLNQGVKRVELGQHPLWEFIDAVDALLSGGSRLGAYDVFGEEIAESDDLGAIICEDWALYPWAMENHGMDFDKCRTARGIGALELLARQHGIPIILQPASIKEAAQAAGAEAEYVSPVHENRHANDAIQHRVFYLAKEGKPPC